MEEEGKGRCNESNFSSIFIIIIITTHLKKKTHISWVQCPFTCAFVSLQLGKVTVITFILVNGKTKNKKTELSKLLTATVLLRGGVKIGTEV